MYAKIITQLFSIKNKSLTPFKHTRLIYTNLQSTNTHSSVCFGSVSTQSLTIGIWGIIRILFSKTKNSSSANGQMNCFSYSL